MKTWLFVLLLVSLGFSAQACFTDATDLVLSEQGTNITLVIIFTVILLAIAYMAGNVTGNVKFTIFAKDEGFHLLFSIILLIAFGGVIVVTCEITEMFYMSFFDNANLQSSCYSPGTGMHSAATCYARTVQRDAEKLAKSYIKGYIDSLMQSTFSWNIQFPLMNSFTSTSGAYKRVVSNQYDMILNSIIIPSLVSISMQKIVIDFIVENIVRWILPIAFLLRVFIPTRPMGNMLIALVVAVYIILPFMYVFNFAMYDSVLTDCEEFKEAVCDNMLDHQCNDPSEACSNPKGFWRVARLIPQAIFLPNLTIAIVVTFIGAMNKALKVIG